MTTEVRQGYMEQQQQRDVGAGGEEVFEVEKGVRVRKSGGVEFAPSFSVAEIEARHSELSAQIEHQKIVIHRAKEEAINAARQANEQEILAREALEFKEFNRARQQEAAIEARRLMVEVSELIEKEKALEQKRAAAHHAAVEKERERVQAKTAEVIAKEEALEAEKREHFYRDVIRKCQALTLRFKLEEEQAKLKLETLQFSLQHGEFRSTSAASKARIVVEVEPRDLPEARQFDTSQVELGIASSTIVQEGVSTIADTRPVEEIVMSESKHRTSSSSGVYSSQRGNIRSEEIYGRGSESISQRDIELREETPRYSASSILPQQSSTTTPTSVVGGDNIKVLPDIKPSASEQGGYHQQQSRGSSLSQPMQSSGEKMLPGSQQLSGQQGVSGGSGAAAQQLPQGTSTASESTASSESGKKQKGGGFFKKFMPTKSHEQH